MTKDGLDQPSVAPTGEVLDLLLHLSERCGLMAPPSNDEASAAGDASTSPRDSLTEQHILWQSHVIDHSATDEFVASKTPAWLRRHEELVQALLLALQNYYAWVQNETMQVADDLKMIERLVVEDRCENGLLIWFLWIQRVVQAWKQALWAEQSLWKDWQKDCLERVYDAQLNMNETMNSPVKKLRRPQYTHGDRVMLDQLVQLLQDEQEAGHETPVSSMTIYGTSTSTKTLTQGRKSSSTIERRFSRHASIQDAVKDFFAVTNPVETKFYTLHGLSGTGKSFVCQQIVSFIQMTYPTVRVFSPHVPVDFLGRTVGAAEATWLKLLASIQSTQAPFLIVLDSMDEFIPDDIALGGTLENRLAAGWLHFLDTLFTTAWPCRGLIIGTCTKMYGAIQRRVDQVFDCGNPSSKAREHFFRKVAGISQGEEENGPIQVKLESVVTLSLGKSFGEMVSQSHNVLSRFSENLSAEKVLDGLIDLFHEHCPPSLMTGLEGLVDLRILSAADLGATQSTPERPANLFGPDMELAWKRLQIELIIPMCHERKLQGLLFAGTEESKNMSGGVLLSGPSGCGKTSLAHETARFAISNDPRVKLVSVSCTSIVHKEVGGSEKALHQLFVVVRQAAPCIVLLEDIETIAAVRGNDNTTEGTMDRLLSTLLVELDGLESQSGSSPFAVIGTTHNHLWIDPALKRPGRLGAVISLGSAAN